MWFRFAVGAPMQALHVDDVGLCLITRVRRRGRSRILWLRFELYVNLARMTVPEE